MDAGQTKYIELNSGSDIVSDSWSQRPFIFFNIWRTVIFNRSKESIQSYKRFIMI